MGQTEPAMCRHCGKLLATRAKGLCWRCSFTPEIRKGYESESKYGRHGVGVGVKSRPCRRPTAALPGTPEKVDVLERRAAAGEDLWHPDDAVWTEDLVRAGHAEADSQADRPEDEDEAA